MKKHVVTFVVIAVLVVVGIIVFKPENPLKDAVAAESRGDYAGARDKYLEALVVNTQGKDLPDKNRSKIVPAETWYGEVSEYISWISAPAEPPSPEASKSYIGAQKCSTFVEDEQYYTDDSVFVHSEEFTLQADWRRAFFPRGVTVEGDHTPLVKQAMAKRLSILRIQALTSYTYKASLLDLSSWKRTDFKLFAEDEVSLLVRGGRYGLICSGEVEFPDGRIWRSPMNLLYVDVPDSSSTKTIVLKTRVKRGG